MIYNVGPLHTSDFLWWFGVWSGIFGMANFVSNVSAGWPCVSLMNEKFDENSFSAETNTSQFQVLSGMKIWHAWRTENYVGAFIDLYA